MELNIHDIARQKMPEIIYLPKRDPEAPERSYRLSDIVTVCEEGILCFIVEALKKVALDDSLSDREKVKLVRESELYANLGDQEWWYLWGEFAHPSDREEEALEELFLKVGLPTQHPDTVYAIESFDEVIAAPAKHKPECLKWVYFPKRTIDYLAKLYLAIIDYYGTEAMVDPENLVALRVMSDWGE